MLYGKETKKALANFTISGITMPTDFIRSLAMIKRACAIANEKEGKLEAALAKAIRSATRDIIKGKYDDEFVPSDNFFEAISSQDTAVELSGHLKTLATSMMKISNDLRWQNSGPLAGLGEISLLELQAGSSIMPGKVNPVIPEAVCMACAQVMGNDVTITIAGQGGNFQLNTYLPVIAYNLLQSINILANSAKLLATKAISTFEVNEENLQDILAYNPILVTSLNSIIGYEKAAEIAKYVYKTKRAIVDVATEMTDIDPEELSKLLDPKNLVSLPSK